MSRDYCVAFPRGAMGLSAVCDCSISWSYSLTIFRVSQLVFGTLCWPLTQKLLKQGYRYHKLGKTFLLNFTRHTMVLI